MMNDELEREGRRENIDADICLRREIEAEILSAGGISSEELQSMAKDIAKICAGAGITAAELHDAKLEVEGPNNDE